MSIKEHAIFRETYGKSTICTCPRCGKKHKVKINFIGRGNPKKFCSTCIEIIKDYDMGPETSTLLPEMRF